MLSSLKTLLFFSLILSSLVVPRFCCDCDEMKCQCNDEEDSFEEPTLCENNFVKLLCDNHRQSCIDCAESMCPDEKAVFFKCACKYGLADSTWSDLFEDICKHECPVKMGNELICCWDEEMEKYVNATDNDPCYSEDYFIKLDQVIQDCASTMECRCQYELTGKCTSGNTNNWRPFGRFGR